MMPICYQKNPLLTNDINTQKNEIHTKNAILKVKKETVVLTIIYIYIYIAQQLSVPTTPVACGVTGSSVNYLKLKSLHFHR